MWAISDLARAARTRRTSCARTAMWPRRLKSRSAAISPLSSQQRSRPREMRTRQRKKRPNCTVSVHKNDEVAQATSSFLWTGFLGYNEHSVNKIQQQGAFYGYRAV